MKAEYRNAHFNFPKTGMTYAEALADGWVETGERKVQPGYVPVKYVDGLSGPVYMGRGSRNGQYFILESSGCGDRCYRVYLAKKGGLNG